mmetsp:Transcript_56283/g.121277  ORF Transcript_56283/g.121277 Transcript_56283/m.121277 type:complete len:374 (-) Transcript_56283:147-1268(-)
MSAAVCGSSAAEDLSRGLRRREREAEAAVDEEEEDDGEESDQATADAGRCRAAGEESDDSTAAPPSEGLRARWADLGDSDLGCSPRFLAAAPEEGGGSSCSALLQPELLTSSPAAARPTRTKWADLADEDDEDDDSGCAAAMKHPAKSGGQERCSSKGQQQKPPMPAGRRRRGAADAEWEDESTSSWYASHDGWGWGWEDQDWAAAAPQTRWRAKGAAAKEAAASSSSAAWVPPPAPRKKRSGHSGSAGGSSGKPQCQFFIGIEEDPSFRVTRKLLGPHGQHMKTVAERSGAKLRLRGRGSRFLEGPEQQESSDPLMLCVSAPDRAAYREATSLVRKLLEDVYRQYREACSAGGWPEPKLSIEMHEGPRPGSF